MPALPELLRQLAMTLVILVVRFQFRDVATVSPHSLSLRLTTPKDQTVLIDTREPREYAVSHLPGALNLTTVQAIEAAAIPRQAPLVVYCSIGYRSAGLARQLRTAGYRQVENLEGSIFLWQMQGLPLMSGTGPATKVHPYDALWGALLNPAVVAYQ